MRRVIVVSSLLAVSATSLFAQSAFDASERGQFLRDGASGPKLMAESQNQAFLIGFTTTNVATFGTLRYARQQGKITYIVSGMQGNMTGAGSSLGASAFASMDLDQKIADMTPTVSLGYDHVKPSANDAYVTLSIARPIDRFEITLSGSYVSDWFGAGVAKLNGGTADIAASTTLAGYFVDAGYITPGKATGVKGAYVRAAMKVGDNKLRVKYGDTGVWTVDVAMPWK